MVQNENTIDRVVRLIIGAVLIYIGWIVLRNDTLGVILDVLGAVALFTASTGFCLLYKIFGNFSTRK